MVVPSSSWNENSPAGSDNVSAGDNRIREMKTQIREVIDVDHDFPSSGQDTDVGQHKQVTLQEQADLGTGAVNATILGSQTVDGKGELVYTDEDDNDVQLTSNGGPYLGAPNAVSDISGVMNLIYPVGIVVTLGVSTNPNTLFGVGTWTAIEGKVIVGISDEVGDEAFDTLDETGGSQTVDLSHTHTLDEGASFSGINTTNNPVVVSGGNLYGTTGAQSANRVENTVDSQLSATQSILQPYIVKYVWQRTA